MRYIRDHAPIYRNAIIVNRYGIRDWTTRRRSTHLQSVSDTRHSMHTCASHGAQACFTSSARARKQISLARWPTRQRPLRRLALAAAMAAAWAARDSTTCLNAGTNTLRMLHAASHLGACPGVTPAMPMPPLESGSRMLSASLLERVVL